MCWSLTLMKLQALRAAILLKRDCNTGAFCECCEIFKNIYFEGHRRTTVSYSSSF